MTQLTPGEITVRKNGQDTYLAVGEGFVEITGDSIAVLTDMAIPSDQIDEAQAEEARRKAEARLAEKITADEAALIQASLSRSLVQLNVKRRHHARK
jgi:F-type H+-transporting ATPase subunit epsilon